MSSGAWHGNGLQSGGSQTGSAGGVEFLPEELASDAVALKRFEREAQTASH